MRFMLKIFSHITRAQKERGGQTPLILNLDTLWKWVISFKIELSFPMQPLRFRVPAVAEEDE